MATTSAALAPSVNLAPGTGVSPGQGGYPMLEVRYATDDASVLRPFVTWLDASAKVRSFSTSRGRSTELDDCDAGTASLRLDNRSRSFDPSHVATIRPMNRWMIREQFTGETQDIFVGYAESYDNTWPNGMDAECVVALVDEFKVLALNHLPTTVPPRGSYSDVVQSDDPSGHWQMNDDPEQFVQVAEVPPPQRQPGLQPDLVWDDSGWFQRGGWA